MNLDIAQSTNVETVDINGQLMEENLIDLYELQEFINLCKDNYFIDYDGYGAYLKYEFDKTGKFIDLKKVAIPSEAAKYLNIPDEATHVDWYNK